MDRGEKGRFIKGHKFNVGRPCSEITRDKISRRQIGKIISIETREKLSKIKGEKHWNYGKHLSEITKVKISKKHKGKKRPFTSDKARKNLSLGMKKRNYKTEIIRNKKISFAKKGELNPNWRGGVSSEIQKRINDPNWNVIRKKVYERDNWTCQICGNHCDNKNNKIQCHHITPHRITQDNSEDNLITLCLSCHLKEEWKYYRRLK